MFSLLYYSSKVFYKMLKLNANSNSTLSEVFNIKIQTNVKADKHATATIE